MVWLPRTPALPEQGLCQLATKLTEQCLAPSKHMIKIYWRNAWNTEMTFPFGCILCMICSSPINKQGTGRPKYIQHHPNWAGTKTSRLLWGSAGPGDLLLTFHQRTHATRLSSISENYFHTSHRGKSWFYEGKTTLWLTLNQDSIYIIALQGKKIVGGLNITLVNVTISVFLTRFSY